MDTKPVASHFVQAQPGDGAMVQSAAKRSGQNTGAQQLPATLQPAAGAGGSAWCSLVCTSASEGTCTCWKRSASFWAKASRCTSVACFFIKAVLKQSSALFSNASKCASCRKECG
jgi:hypothetical protein